MDLQQFVSVIVLATVPFLYNELRRLRPKLEALQVIERVCQKHLADLLEGQQKTAEVLEQKKAADAEALQQILAKLEGRK